MLDFVEEPLDEISLAVEHKITIALHLSVSFWRDHWSDCPPIEYIDQRIGVVGLVANERTRIDIFE